MKKASELNVREIEKKINYTFRDKSLLIQAFTRTSYCNEVNPSSKIKFHSNEVLEFFGDGVLSLSIISFLLKECTERYEHGIRTELGEGDFSNIKSKLSDKQNLSKSMKALGLEKHLLMGEGDSKLGIQNEPSVMEDLFESIVGAIFIDSDMNIGAVISAVSGMLDMSVYTDKQRVAQSAKNALQEWCADKKHRLPAPRYETLSEDGPDHKKTYMRGCYIGDKLMGRGIGKNFKLADAAAAEDALQALMAQNSQELTTEIGKNNANPKLTADAKIQSNENTKKEKATAETKSDTQAKTTVKPSHTSCIALKSYASSNKKPSPVFKDLGEKKLGSRVECSVECSFDSHSVVGTGPSRPEAREEASRLILELISNKKADASKNEVQKSNTESDGKKNKKKSAKGYTAKHRQPSKVTKAKSSVK